MNTFTVRLLGVIDGLNKIVGWLMALCLGAMTVLISWQVFARFAMGNSLTFSEEVSRFLMIWLTMLGSAYAVRRGSLLAVDLVPELLSGRARFIVNLVAHLVSLAFYVVLVVYGWNIAQAVAFQSAPATGVSMFWPMFALCAGGALCLINTIAVVIEDILQGGESPHQDHLILEAEG
ncbi:TRAP transporter small permease [Ornithinicoccus hortensis]|uniref:TRAP-type C4-dicarboxylate transport system permease small subunit n=1 Tax=Ornithinicoccus hortensis TaxID=82346 RepID=A0A542YWS3_9MICO|nr:TRAP transporter small permease [Ornithinicoccus hortensis]TQL52481.1 TRAP-type C4-dicarboxylate transport system permease small subunit [Ornithinicoccus hortensis]